MWQLLTVRLQQMMAAVRETRKVTLSHIGGDFVSAAICRDGIETRLIVRRDW